MARAYAQVKVSLWDDDSEFATLTPHAKLLYLHLISRRDLSLAGHLFIRTQRWADACFNGSTDNVDEAIEELTDARYVLADHKTGEILVRTFIRHDGGWRNSKMRKAIKGAIDRMESADLSTIASRSLANCEQHLVEDQSDWASEHRYEDQPDQVSDPTCSHTPATSNLQPAASNPEPDPANTPTVRPRTAAAVAIEMLINHKAQTARTPGLKEHLKKTLPDEHRMAIKSYLDSHFNTTAEEIASAVLGVPGLTYTPAPVKEAWYADPDCERRDGDGWFAPTAPGARLESCVCRRPDPYQHLAPVTPIQGAT